MGLFLAAKPAVYVARHATAVAIGGGGRREVSDVTALPPGWVFSSRVPGTEVSLKYSLANGDTPLKKPAHVRGLCRNRKQKLRERKRESWQRDCKAGSESKNLISEKETEGTVNKTIY